jgi:hypothetical protein
MLNGEPLIGRQRMGTQALDEGVPPDIWPNINDLREDLLDTQKSLA